MMIGGLCGLAWAAGLRGLMSELARSESTVSWSGTFVWILLPGAVVGALLGWAEHIRRTAGRRHWRWLALAPFAFTAVVFTPAGIEQLLDDGIGGGAIGFALLGISGGYALSGNGRLWARLACGLVAVAPMALWTVFASDSFGPAFALDTPRGAWIAVFVSSYLAVLMLACSIPHRPIVATRSAAAPSPGLVSRHEDSGRL